MKKEIIYEIKPLPNETQSSYLKKKNSIEQEFEKTRSKKRSKIKID